MKNKTLTMFGGLFVLSFLLVFSAYGQIMPDQVAPAGQGGGDDAKAKAEEAKKKAELQKKLEKVLKDKEKDVSMCAKSVYTDDQTFNITAGVTLRVGPGKKVEKPNISGGSGDEKQRANFLKCVEGKFQSLNIPDMGEGTATISHTYTIEKKEEKKENEQQQGN